MAHMARFFLGLALVRRLGTSAQLVPGAVTRTISTTLEPSAGKARGTTWTKAANALDALRRNGQALLVNHSPEIYVVPEFMTSSECDEIARVHHTRMESHDQGGDWCFDAGSSNYGPSFGKTMAAMVEAGDAEASDSDTVCMSSERGKAVAAEFNKSITYSSASMHRRGETEAIDRITERAKTRLGLEPAVAMYPQVLQYGVGEAYHAHTDCANGRAVDRAATLLVYLTDASDGLEGGETAFTNLGITIRPQRGMAVIFENLANVSQICDENSMHQALAVRNGTKLVWQQWFYQAPAHIGIDPWALKFDDIGSGRHYLWAPGAREADERAASIANDIRQAEQCKSPTCALTIFEDAMLKLQALLREHPAHAYACARAAECRLRARSLVKRDEAEQRNYDKEILKALRCAVHDYSNAADGLTLKLELSNHLFQMQHDDREEIRQLLDEVAELAHPAHEVRWGKSEDEQRSYYDRAREFLDEHFSAEREQSGKAET